MKKLFIALAILFAGANLEAQDATTLVESSYKAMKYDVLKSFTSFKIKGSQFNAMMGQNMPIEVLIKRPNKILMNVEVMGSKITQAYNGEKGWAINPLQGSSTPEDLPDEAIPQLTQMIDLLESPINNFGDNETKFELPEVKTEKIGETTYNLVKMTTKEGEVYTLYLDAVTNWFYKAVTEIPTEEGNAKLEFIFAEKTKVKGAVMPKVLEIMFKGEKNATINFDEYEVDTITDDSIFNKPAK